MASTEVDRHTGVDVEDVPSAAWGWSNEDHRVIHIGGILAEDGSQNFPNAQIFVPQADFEYWTSDARIGTPGEGSMLATKKKYDDYSYDRVEPEARFDGGLPRWPICRPPRACGGTCSCCSTSAARPRRA